MKKKTNLGIIKKWERFSKEEKYTKRTRIRNYFTLNFVEKIFFHFYESSSDFTYIVDEHERVVCGTNLFY
jgi:hypothetical protein